MLAHNHHQRVGKGGEAVVPQYHHREPLGVTPQGGIKPSNRNQYSSSVIDLCSSGSTHAPTTAKGKQSTATAYSQCSTQVSSQSTQWQSSQPEQLSQVQPSHHHSQIQRSVSSSKVSSKSSITQHVEPMTRSNSNPVTPAAKRPDTSSCKRSATHVTATPANTSKSNNNTTTTTASLAPEDVQKGGAAGFSYVEDDNAKHFIRTPGGRYLNINEFLMKVDQNAYERFCNHCPGAMNAAVYDASRHWDWVRLENEVDARSFHLAFADGSPVETFRRFTLMCIFRFFTKWNANASTIHYAVNNLNRVFIAQTIADNTITEETYTGIALACIRLAIKHEDTPSFNRLWHNPIRSLWKHAGFGKKIEDQITLKKINEVEFNAVQVLQNPLLTPPSPLDFLDRYLSVGGWPKEYISAYRDLAHYLIDLSLFAPKLEGLAGTRPSLIAAAALTLSVKIHNAMPGFEKYEFWPKRLEVLTNYPIKRLAPTIRALSSLVKNKPHGEELLSKYHEAWSNRVWQ